MAPQHPTDVFSWEKFCNILDLKLQDVAKKDDFGPIVAEIMELRDENKKLRNEISQLTSRLEIIDRKTRSTNIIVNGMKSKNLTTAKTDFTQLCSNTLGVNANVVTARALPNEERYIFTLESNFQAANVLAAKDKLKGKDIFIQKDYTKDEQNVRYNLRKLNRNISKLKKNAKVRMGEFCVFINDRKYSWMKGQVAAYNNDDAQYLKSILSDDSYPIGVIAKDGYPIDLNLSKFTKT